MGYLYLFTPNYDSWGGHYREERDPPVSPNVVALYTIVIVDIPLIADDSHFPRRRYAQPTV